MYLIPATDLPHVSLAPPPCQVCRSCMYLARLQCWPEEAGWRIAARTFLLTLGGCAAMHIQLSRYGASWHSDPLRASCSSVLPAWATTRCAWRAPWGWSKIGALVLCSCSPLSLSPRFFPISIVHVKRGPSRTPTDKFAQKFEATLKMRNLKYTETPLNPNSRPAVIMPPVQANKLRLPEANADAAQFPPPER